MTLRQLLNIDPTNPKPLIAVPMTLGPSDKFGPFAQALDEQNPDLVEWRADYIVDAFSQDVIWQEVKAGAQAEVQAKEVSTLTQAKLMSELDTARAEFLENWPLMQVQIVKELVANAFQTVNNRPLILTYRSKAQGGMGELDEPAIASFLVTALKAGFHFAAVDLEDSMDEGLKAKVIEAAEKVKTPVILSYHDWQNTPKDLADIVKKMSQEAVQVLKLAVMPENEKDVDFVLETCQQMNQQVDQDLIMIAMGGLGERSRIEGYRYGSQLTFASLGKKYESASGQLTVKDLLRAWS
ncbi:type I 3-dehydroquinate dehydratase [Eupransor demetentiae]|uniref:3-dehydroquinate dehydratase n=1 Tax=Eupransor demetentiae TaxID=3109584 RepID=A0ABM9N3U6_9LACO|nr:3-dehydroquinate dehydratase (AroD) [Lactobacillaceae bacterium LMG 33000]